MVVILHKLETCINNTRSLKIIWSLVRIRLSTLAYSNFYKIMLFHQTLQTGNLANVFRVDTIYDV